MNSINTFGGMERINLFEPINQNLTKCKYKPSYEILPNFQSDIGHKADIAFFNDS